MNTLRHKLWLEIITLGAIGACVLFITACAEQPKEVAGPVRVIKPAPSRFQVRANVLEPISDGIYHGAFPDLKSDALDSITNDVLAMERLADKKLAWVQFENDWAKTTQFPWKAVEDISKMKKIPYIRILPRSQSQQNQGADPVYTMDNFLKGYFDEILEQWARMAKAADTQMILEFAPEMNGRWYPWNGLWNGGSEKTGYGDPNLADGPERFRDAYRRVVNIFKRVGVQKVTWMFHVDAQPQPKEAWNSMSNYYPGDDYIDWIGVSVFGAQHPGDYWSSFPQILDSAYNELTSISPLKPVAIVEFAVTEKPNDPNAKARWIQEALESIKKGWYPHVKAVNYWHERNWLPDPTFSFRIDSSMAALSAYRSGVADSLFITEGRFTTTAVSGVRP